jgi:hypothetical protein
MPLRPGSPNNLKNSRRHFDGYAADVRKPLWIRRPGKLAANRP